MRFTFGLQQQEKEVMAIASEKMKIRISQAMRTPYEFFFFKCAISILILNKK